MAKCKNGVFAEVPNTKDEVPPFTEMFKEFNSSYYKELYRTECLATFAWEQILPIFGRYWNASTGHAHAFKHPPALDGAASGSSPTPTEWRPYQGGSSLHEDCHPEKEVKTALREAAAASIDMPYQEPYLAESGYFFIS